VDVEWLAVPGNPSEVLIKASEDAVLLVVGSRGVGGFKGLIMGSVSTQCVHYSHCPVLVVRASH
jgi:nucleotide-binding universal stress UspA family protein